MYEEKKTKLFSYQIKTHHLQEISFLRKQARATTTPFVQHPTTYNSMRWGASRTKGVKNVSYPVGRSEGKFMSFRMVAALLGSLGFERISPHTI